MENGNGKHGKKIISIGCLYPNSQKNRSNEYDKKMYKVVKYLYTYPEQIIKSNVEYEYAKKLASVLNKYNKNLYVTYAILKEEL